jgi:hypothetical protein
MSPRTCLCWPHLFAPFLVAINLSVSSNAGARDPAARAQFVRSSPCPVTGAHRGPCPGYVVDHIQPLCAGGADHPSNMQWQTIEAAKVKDREERAACAALRRSVQQ